jgi:hypothetical protein
MGWIKRNLFFVVGGAVALVLLGAAGFYIFRGWSQNGAASNALNEIYQNLQTLAQENPAPGNDKINNTAIAAKQTATLNAWIAKAEDDYFKPIPAIPPDVPVTSEAYAAALRRVIDQLQHEADNASVTLPPKYDFSFSAQRPLVQFAPGSLAPLAAQLGEVKAISEVLFAARINALDGIQRVRVSVDDANGPQSDYIDESQVTNDLAVMKPYVITFRSFTPELARVIADFAMSSNTFIIKSINVQPASAAANAAAGVAGMPGAVPPGAGYPAGLYRPGVPAQSPTTLRGGLPTVLKEQLLRITMEVEIVKLLPTS